MRERLAERYQETHCFTGQFRQYARTAEGSNVACFSNICIGNDWVADHVWIHRSKHMKKQELKTGDRVQFEARVERYAKNGIPRPHVEAIEWDYCLDKIREFVVIKRHEGD
jgi:hypothetical protein